MLEPTPTHDTVYDVDEQRLAKIYGQAALDAAGDSAGQGSLVAELNELGELLRRQPRLAQLFSSELINKDEKLALLERVLGKVASTGLLNTLRVMTAHGRLGAVRSVARAADQLWEQRCSRTRVELSTAHPIEASLEKEILTSLTRLLGSDPTIVKRVDPSILGGFVIRAGDRVYDASVRSELERTRAGMVARAVEAIEARPETFFDRIGMAFSD